MKIYTVLFLIILSTVYSQKQVAITIDDLVNTRLYEELDYNAPLLDKINELQIPVAIFINPVNIYYRDSIVKNFELFDRWVSNDLVTLGNHTYNHPRYSEVGFPDFVLNIEKAEHIIEPHAKRYNKDLKYFRFPYNDLGSDTASNEMIKAYLESKDYVLTPHTVESSDWMFNFVYRHYLSEGDTLAAKEIAEDYIATTIDYFRYYDSVTVDKYDRPIKHIYLCHDNKLHADYFGELIQAIRDEGYSFITLEEAMQDEIYQSTDYFYLKWGISWVYRWIADTEERNEVGKNKPSKRDIEKKFKEMNGRY